jgi:hypothetical protein
VHGETKFISPIGNYVPVRSPLISISVARSVLFCDAKEIFALVETGALLFAFDIRTKSARQVCLRILTQSLVDHLQKKTPDRNLDEVKIYQSIWPEPKQICASARVIARTMSCDADHVNKLLKEKCLLEFTRRDGRTQTPKIGRENFLQFLKTRRVL